MIDRALNTKDAGTIDVSNLQWWTVREVANLLRFDASTVRRWCESSKIEAVRMPGGNWRIHQSVVKKLEDGGLPNERQAVNADDRLRFATNYFPDEE